MKRMFDIFSRCARDDPGQESVADWQRSAAIAGVAVSAFLIGCVAPPDIDNFSASVESIMEGDEVILTWSTAEADSVRLFPLDTLLPLDGSLADKPPGDVTYRLVASGPGGMIERVLPITVTVRTPPPEADDPLNRPIWLEGGRFMMGSDVGFDVRRPAHPVTVSGFWIQEHEVTHDEYARFDSGHQFPSGQGRYPVANITWQEALDYAVSRGGGLPTEAQWEFAARGPEGRAYPWGEARPTCDRAQFSGCDGDAIDVMSHPNGATPDGVYDLAGNVEEWVADTWHYGYVGAPDDGSAWVSEGAASRVGRGGSWAWPSYLLMGRDEIDTGARVRGQTRRGASVDLGFRVVWSSARGQS